ncbi:MULTISPECIES: ferrochelatase [unclassified Spongiibacter]|uniref:ferrochelatase n=1 Tax=unclassified Spongiibacter TaxID=2631504 RepID=UPI000C092C15|nr:MULTISPECIES: ferrochelatase [unclassified Spongiibacter]MAK43051.1 ferrochelatase [Spongiibacter sp.]|tara:strand:+ start:8010 stop:8999 length:990 start_codon:yes stop_codon:yes gene_type:complete
MKTAVVFINLGTPDTPNTSGVRRFLREFLSDRRVVEVPRLIWLAILYLIILPFRSPRVAKAYRQIWFGDTSPLRHFSESLVEGVASKLSQEYPDADITVRLAMTYGQPSVESQIHELCDAGVENIFFVPLYPQYSATTTAAAMDAVYRCFARMRDIPQWSWLRNYHNHEAYVAALGESVKAHWQKNGRAERLLMSFHGIPKRNVDLGDPYEQHCNETAEAVAKYLELDDTQWLRTFQSRLGKAEWLTPYTDRTVEALPAEGVKSLDVMCPAFAVECLETLEEIDGEAKEIFMEHGGEGFNYIPCLNDSDAHQDLMLELCRPFVSQSLKK